MKTKIWFLTLFSCLIIVAGCDSSQEKISPELYNNAIIALQESAIDATKTYYTALNTEYNGQNLTVLYADLQASLEKLHQQALQASGYRNDTTLKNAVIAYITGLQMMLDAYEKPTVELLMNYSGDAQHFYEKDQARISSGVMAIATELTILDQKLDEQQAIFAKKHGYQLP